MRKLIICILTAFLYAMPIWADGTKEIDLSKLDHSEWAFPLPNAKVISPFGGKRRHSGVDLKTHANDSIRAAFDGEVTRSAYHSGYGQCIEIKHHDGLRTLYSHQSKNLVKVGDKVKAGQVIGLTGRTGRATTEHLHFELYCYAHRHNPALIYDYARHKLKPIKIRVSKKNGITLKTK